MLNILLPAVYPGSFGLQTLPEICQELRAFLCSAPIDIHLQQRNQDLVKIMESVSHLATQYAGKQSADWSEISFTVQLAATEPRFKRNLNDARSKQESFGPKICVNSVSCLFTHRYFLT